jgi:hypothetical protein
MKTGRIKSLKPPKRKGGRPFWAKSDPWKKKVENKKDPKTEP